MILNQKFIMIAIFFSLNFIAIVSSDAGRESPLRNLRGQRAASSSVLEGQIVVENSDVLVFNNDNREQVGIDRDPSALILDNSAISPALRVAPAVVMHMVSSKLNSEKESALVDDKKEGSSVGSALEGQVSGVLSAVGLSSSNDAMKLANFDQDFDLAQLSLGEYGDAQGAKGIVLHVRSVGVSFEDLAEQFPRVSSGLVTPNQ